MNTKKMLAVIAVLAMACAAFAVAVPSEDVAADDEVITVQGDVTSAISGTATQTIKIIADTTIKGGSITSEGTLIVDEGVTVTIEDGLLFIAGDATINGNIVSKCGDCAGSAEITSITKGLIIAPKEYKDVVINGSIIATGNSKTATTDFQKSLVLDACNITGTYPYDNTSGPINNNTITVNGSVTIGTSTIAYLDCVEFSEKSSLYVYGAIDTTTYANCEIDTAGYVMLDARMTTDANVFDIVFTEKSAVVDIRTLSGYIDITDDKMHAYDYGNDAYYINKDKNAIYYDADGTTEQTAFKNVAKSKISLTNVDNLKITETVDTQIVYDEYQSVNKMVANVKMIVAALDAEKDVEKDANGDATIEVLAGEDVVFESMTVDSVAITIDAGATATAAGTINYTIGGTDGITVDGTLDVTGSIVADAVIDGSGTINAATFTVVSGNDTYYNYTTLKNAIELGATDIEMMGALVISEDIKVPATVKLTLDTAAMDNSLYVPTLLVKKGATLTIADGATFVAPYVAATTSPVAPAEYAAMDVKGTLVFEDIYKNIALNDNVIYAEVKLVSGKTETYTNVYVAFAAAKSGDELQAYNPLNYEITLDADLILPAGVQFDNTLSVDSAKYASIYVKTGVQFTVAGKLVIKGENSGIKIYPGGNGWADKTPKADGGVMKEYSVLAIGPQGVIEFKMTEAGKETVAGSLYKTHKVNGAYFAMKDDAITNYYITNIELAVAGILETVGDKVDIYGDATLDSLTVTGKADERFTLNINSGEFAVKNFVFSYGKVDVVAGVVLTGTFGTSTGKIVFDGAEVMGESTFNEEWIDDAMNLKVNGSFESKKATSISGTVYFDDVTYESNAEEIDDSKFIVPAGSKLIVIGTVSFSEDDSEYIEVLAEGTVIVSYLGSFEADIVSVLGTLDVQKVDGKSGSVNIRNLYVGGSLDSFETPYYITAIGTASVIGSGIFTLDSCLLVVFKGASVTADVLADWMAKDTTKSTEFYVDGALWITAYGHGLVYLEDDGYGDVSYFTPVLTNKKFDSWQTYDEEKKDYVSLTDRTYVGDVDKVYAKIETDIYLVEINTEVGIDNVYIDGKILEKDGLEFSGYVAAGTHTITIAASNGYSAENAYIAEIDGKAVVGSGLSFTVNDDSYIVQDTYYHKDIVLQGVQKSGYDVDPETHPETVAGLSVTEILLIVVVIIMAIMAVVLILRLNRS